jgi:hypothetical protein
MAQSSARAQAWGPLLLYAGSTNGDTSPTAGPDFGDGCVGLRLRTTSSSVSRERKKGQLPPDLCPSSLIGNTTLRVLLPLYSIREEIVRKLCYG